LVFALLVCAGFAETLRGTTNLETNGTFQIIADPDVLKVQLHGIPDLVSDNFDATNPTAALLLWAEAFDNPLPNQSTGNSRPTPQLFLTLMLVGGLVRLFTSHT